MSVALAYTDVIAPPTILKNEEIGGADWFDPLLDSSMI